MANQSFAFNDEELGYLRAALSNQVQVFRRSRAKHVSGSAMFNAHTDEINRVQSILTKVGG